MDNNLLKALEHISPADCDYLEWINVGMALKSEGYDCSVWDSWSSQESRYRSGECEKKWNTFTSGGVSGGTIVKMAKDRGYDPQASKMLDWDDYIEYDGDAFESYAMSGSWSPSSDLITYIRTLFNDDDIVGYVTDEVWQREDDNKWMPGKGVYVKTAGEILSGLEKYGDDLGATLGDYNESAGAYIRFNALDGNGVKNENVVSFKYALVESDVCSIADQDAMLRKLELPIACLVHSGGKSLHAIVKVDADNYNEYRQRVEFLYDYLEKEGFSIDKQNRNPSRLSRMPGVMRNGNRQYLIGANIGRRSWIDWMDFVEGESDELPGIVTLDSVFDDMPELPPEIIEGVLRQGHKMLISGPSKAGKSFAMMELCAAFAEGAEWLGFKCKQCKVLYVNLEIDPATTAKRFSDIYKAIGYKTHHLENISVWNLRGLSMPLDTLAPKLIRKIQGQGFGVVIIDPIYKVLTGDENSASDMGKFCNQFDKICTELGCSSIYCHHHSKGAKGGVKAMDRASGSGVFARDPDALLDIIELPLNESIKAQYADDGASAWRLESSLREFRNFKPKDFWFRHPLHIIDNQGILSELLPESGQKTAGRPTGGGHTEEIAFQYDCLKSIGEQIIHAKELAQALNISEKTLRAWVEKGNSFKIMKGIVYDFRQ